MKAARPIGRVRWVLVSMVLTFFSAASAWGYYFDDRRSRWAMPTLPLVGDAYNCNSSMYESSKGSKKALVATPSHSGGRCQPPKAVSRCCATANAMSSRPGPATTCTPMGNPSGDVPPRTTAAGHPVRL